MTRCSCGEALTGGFDFEEDGRLVRRHAARASFFCFTWEDAARYAATSITFHDVLLADGSLVSAGCHSSVAQARYCACGELLVPYTLALGGLPVPANGCTKVDFYFADAAHVHRYVHGSEPVHDYYWKDELRSGRHERADAAATPEPSFVTGDGEAGFRLAPGVSLLSLRKADETTLRRVIDDGFQIFEAFLATL